MNPDLVKVLIDALESTWLCPHPPEKTLEINPTSAESHKLRHFKAAGINRASLGIQSLNDKILRFLGRKHSCQEAIEAIQMARATFEHFSFDLIYAHAHHHNPEAWWAELDKALTLHPPHLSLYQLTYEPGTPFYHQMKAGLIPVLDEDQASLLYEQTTSRMHAAGFQSYEISNYALPGHECRHNLAYWHTQDYIGIGPGAHGRITLEGTRWAVQNYRTPQRWIDAVSAHGHGIEQMHALSPQQVFQERLLMGLRLATGLSIADLAPKDPTFFDKVTVLRQEGWLTPEEDRLQLTLSGRLRMDALLAFLQ